MGSNREGQFREFLEPAIITLKRPGSSTRRISCPWKPIGLWHMERSCVHHNHVPSTNMAGHPSSRRLTKQEKHTVNKTLAAGFPALQTVMSLRQENHIKGLIDGM
ncbi:hypothetical protein CCR75_000159 [Bremia lactucae]|uniref:Uncharacterized protein n=1 Tax=Bremia lactucae TaxID=4779 RepID=A0A976FP57_BRELC|nr:hypothetical protein CCR75_000159 [Bremia lactucae]